MLERKVFSSAETHDPALGDKKELLLERHKLAINKVITAAKALSDDQKRKLLEISARMERNHPTR